MTLPAPGSGDQRSYRSTSQQVLLRVLDALAERPFNGLPLADVVSRLGTSASRDQVYRALKNLELAGWAELSGDAWRLTPHLTRASERVRVAIADLHRRYLEQEESWP